MTRIGLPTALSGQFKPDGTYGTPGYTPDYKRLILNDPQYAQTASNLSAQNIAGDAALTGGIQADTVNYGQAPDILQAARQLGLAPNSPLLQALHAALNPQITGAAAGNPFSTVANEQFTHDKALGQNLASIGGRVGNGGMLQTSDLGVADTLENHRFGAANQSNLLSYLSGISHAFDQHAQAQNTNANTLATAAGTAATRQAALNPVQPGTGMFGPGGLTPHRVMPGLNMPKPGPQAGAYRAPGFVSHGGTI